VNPDVAIVGFPMAMALGLLFGMGPCLVSCMPYLGPVFLGVEGGVAQSWRILLPLSLGRLTAYGGFGAVCGWLGQQVVDDTATASIRLALGAAGVMVGVALLLRRRKGCGVPANKGTASALQRMERTPRPLLPGGLYLMGLGMALNPCAPLSVVLLAAAAGASAFGGGMLGLGFGLGAITVPALVYGFGMAYFGAQLREKLGPWRSRIEILSAGLLVAVGLRQMIFLL
jgi:thiol:disulfide interchange protein DsbD